VFPTHEPSRPANLIPSGWKPAPQFAVVTISQLANEVSIIVRYFSQRSQSRKNLWRARVDRTTKLRAQHPSPDYSLADEIKLINKIASRDELLSECYDLAWSFSSLLVFWLVGAAVFSSIEGWTFWNAWYFEIVFSLTIGMWAFAPFA
jgi:potassium channel subfamily K